MRCLLQDAGKPDRAGLYIARHCEYFWSTVPYLARDPRRVEDLDSRGLDHGADAARYACRYLGAAKVAGYALTLLTRKPMAMTEFGPVPATHTYRKQTSPKESRRYRRTVGGSSEAMTSTRCAITE
jgi:hypothetical protein